MVSLVLTPESIREDGGSSTVSATLDRPSSEDTTVTVSTTAVSPTMPSDFTQTGTTAHDRGGREDERRDGHHHGRRQLGVDGGEERHGVGLGGEHPGGDGAGHADADDHRRRIGVDGGDVDGLSGERGGGRGGSRPDGDGDRDPGRRRPGGGHRGDGLGGRGQRGSGDGLHGGAQLHGDHRRERDERRGDVHARPGGRRHRRAGRDGDRNRNHDLQPGRGALDGAQGDDRRRRRDPHRHPGPDAGVDLRGRRREHGDRDPRPPVERGDGNRRLRDAGIPGGGG